MNKKHISLILIIVAFLTVMAMSLWGKEAEISTSILVENVQLYDSNLHEIVKIKDGTENTLEYSITKSKVEQEKYYYVLALKVNPDNATDSSITASCKNGKYLESIAQIEKEDFLQYSSLTSVSLEGVVYYYLLTFTKQEPCLLVFEYNAAINIQEQRLQIVFEGYQSGGEIEF